MTRATWLLTLTAAFAVTLSLADVAATKLVTIGETVMPGGTYLFAAIFIIRDALHRLAGAQYVRRLIWAAAIINLGVAAYLYVITRMPAPSFYPHADAWNAIFAFAPAIVLGSITAAVISQLVNTGLYQRASEARWPLWARSIGSNAISLPLDGVIFSALAFVVLPPLFGAQPLDLVTAAAQVASGQAAWKAATVALLTPLLYLVPQPDALTAASAEKEGGPGA